MKTNTYYIQQTHLTKNELLAIVGGANPTPQQINSALAAGLFGGATGNVLGTGNPMTTFSLGIGAVTGFFLPPKPKKP